MKKVVVLVFTMLITSCTIKAYNVSIKNNTEREIEVRVELSGPARCREMVATIFRGITQKIDIRTCCVRLVRAKPKESYTWVTYFPARGGFYGYCSDLNIVISENNTHELLIEER